MRRKVISEGGYIILQHYVALAGLSLFWTGARRRGFTLQDVVRYMVEAPAKQASLHHRKAALKVGCDADFVIWNPNETFKVRQEVEEEERTKNILRCDCDSAYHGRKK